MSQKIIKQKTNVPKQNVIPTMSSIYNTLALGLDVLAITSSGYKSIDGPLPGYAYFLASESISSLTPVTFYDTLYKQ